MVSKIADESITAVEENHHDESQDMDGQEEDSRRDLNCISDWTIEVIPDEKYPGVSCKPGTRQEDKAGQGRARQTIGMRWFGAWACERKLGQVDQRHFAP